jgi:hypothetical protein
MLYPEDRGSISPQNIRKRLPVYTVYYLLTYGLFNDAANTSHYTVSIQGDDLEDHGRGHDRCEQPETCKDGVRLRRMTFRKHWNIKTEEVMGEQGTLPSKELHKLYVKK